MFISSAETCETCIRYRGASHEEKKKFQTLQVTLDLMKTTQCDLLIFLFLLQVVDFCMYFYKFNTFLYMERSIQKWVLWILFYNINVKSIYLPKY